MSAPKPPPRRPSGRLLAGLVLLLVALTGGLAGVALDRQVLLPRMVAGRPFEQGLGRHPPRDREFRNRFAREVGLSAEQQIRIDSMMDRLGEAIRESA